MIIYRFNGRAEAFKGCGMLLIDPIVDSSLTRIKKAAQSRTRKIKKSGVQYDLWLEKLWIKAPALTDIIEIITTEDPGILIEKTERLQNWSSVKQVKE